MCLDHVSRRHFLQLSAASAAALAAGVTSGRTAEARPRSMAAAQPGPDVATAGMIDFHVHTYPDNFGRTVGEWWRTRRLGQRDDL